MLNADKSYYKEHKEPLFSSHMLDLSLEPKAQNIAACVKYFKHMTPLNLWLKMEIGVMGSKEDGVGNTSAKNASLYTQPKDIYDIYKALSMISPNFSITAAFGNVHGIYKPSNVKLLPSLLGKHQKFIKEHLERKATKPIFLMFHGGSGSSKDDIFTAVSNGVIKMNVDTDTQFAYLIGVWDFLQKNKDYLKAQVGNPEGVDKPNKKVA